MGSDKRKRKRLSARDKAWTQGFAAALATVHFMSTDKALAGDVLRESGLTLDDLREAHVEPCDMEKIEASASDPLSRYT